MSATAVSGVLDRANHDDAFLDWLRTDPDAALSRYEGLTPAERDALAGGAEDDVWDAAGVLKADWDIAIVVVVAY